MKIWWRGSVLLGLLLAFPLQAQTLFYDDFESGVGGDIVWSPLGNVSGDTHTPNGFNNLVTTDTSHALSGTHSARAWEADPAHWNGYADFGTTGSALKASAYLYEDMNYIPPYSDQPTWKQPYIEVRSMFSLWGDNSSDTLSGIATSTDYVQFRLIPDVDRPPNAAPDHYSYGIETKYNDDHGLGIIDTGVLRAKSWTKFTIEADSVASGGQVRFYIDDALVGSSYRSGPDLRWVMIGSDKISYENFWYDDISVFNASGDYNGDQNVDASDYVAWRKNAGAVSDAYTTWRQHFGSSLGVGPQGASIVPEPASLNLIAALGLLVLSRGRNPEALRSKWMSRPHRGCN
jgi:hypothetical protein